MEEQLPAGLREGEIAEFIEHDEVETGQVVGDAALPAGAGLGLEPVDQIDNIEEAAPRAVADQRPRNGDRKMGFARAGGYTIIKDYTRERDSFRFKASSAAAAQKRGEKANPLTKP
jgi:hypothetical protein